MAYFSGMTTFPGDAFPVSDDDFTVVTPEQNTLIPVIFCLVISINSQGTASRKSFSGGRLKVRR
jgi:hypothetical protein